MCCLPDYLNNGLNKVQISDQQNAVQGACCLNLRLAFTVVPLFLGLQGYPGCSGFR